MTTATLDEQTNLDVGRQLSAVRHARTAMDRLEFRDDDTVRNGEGVTLIGHAAVFDQETELFDLGHLRVRERIAPGAFKRVLETGPDVHLTIGHDFDKSMARTGVSGIGGLDLSEDETGLRVHARLDPALSFVQDLAVQIKRGIVDQMSFMFNIGEVDLEIATDDEGNEDELRTIREVSNLFDVTVVARGAYPQTDATLRAAIQRVASFEPTGPDRGSRRVDNPVGVTSSPEVASSESTGEGQMVDRDKRRARLQTDIALALGKAQRNGTIRANRSGGGGARRC